MLCKLVAELPDGPEWSYEVKWDGYRAIGQKRPDGLRLSSRNDKSFTRTFPSVAQALADLRCKSATVDGEIVAIGVDGRPDFQVLQSHRSQSPTLRFMLFDLLEVNGRDLTEFPLEARRLALQKILPPESNLLGFSHELHGTVASLMAQARAAGIEGIVAKSRDSSYEPGERSGMWMKWKAERKDTFFIGGYVPNGRSFEELLVGRRRGRQLEYVSSVRAGFTSIQKGKIMDAIRPLTLPHCPFSNLPETGKSRWGRSLDEEKMRECRWVNPRVKAEITFVEWTDGGKLRHSKFSKLIQGRSK
ncbi:non-homologous end-joining DNA ligase [Verrucomicrobium sp. BvORR106]|uniref:non-homologous end-joining DNA ligase n=1 Tax=Verrucomicrobium sp. BvORR106 TaxID=1403819 RepID=UPI002240EB8B|nr:non-homologous end-joining DNA ligase [Verrucomicrobium sp. BvORR106]